MRSLGMEYSWSEPERCLFTGCTGGELCHIANCRLPIADFANDNRQLAIGIDNVSC